MSDKSIPGGVSWLVEDACRQEIAGAESPGLDGETLIRAIREQVSYLCDQLCVENIRDYATVPDHVRVINVHRIPQPSLNPFDLQRRTA